jgi:hypothetical protein
MNTQLDRRQILNQLTILESKSWTTADLLSSSSSSSRDDVIRRHFKNHQYFSVSRQNPAHSDLHSTLSVFCENTYDKDKFDKVEYRVFRELMLNF